jgi:hypothetical protein
MRDAHWRRVASRSSSAKWRAYGPIEPVPTVSIGRRQRKLPSRTHTPPGIGVRMIERPAGVPLRQYQSSPGEAGPEREEESGLFASGHWVRDTAPAEAPLPLRRGWILFVTVLSMALLPVVIGLSLCASQPAPDVPPTRSRVDAVPGAEQPPAAPAEALAPAPPDDSSAPPGEATQAPGDEPKLPAAKNRVHRAPAPARQFDVPRRAAPVGPLRSREP